MKKKKKKTRSKRKLIDELKRTHQKLQIRNARSPLSSIFETLSIANNSYKELEDLLGNGDEMQKQARNRFIQNRNQKITGQIGSKSFLTWSLTGWEIPGADMN